MKFLNMKFNCIRCGKIVCKLDLRKPENKEEALTISYCGDCLDKNLENARSLFQR